MSQHKNRRQNKPPIWLPIVGLIGLGLLVAVLLRGNDVILFNPKGLIANQQHQLMVVSVLIMLCIAVPTLTLLYFFAWKYREGNTKARYNPRSRHSKWLVPIVWMLPTAVVLVLVSIMLPATQKLEPQKSIESETAPLTIQVIGLRWKWLFIYPEQNISAVNFVQIPVDTPVRFELTTDETPMSSFWIPHLGGQLYAMTEHINRLNLMADTLGDYQGKAAEINGAGFAGMKFTARVSTKDDFDKWVQQASASPHKLTSSEYKKLLEPSQSNPVAIYRSSGSEIFSSVVSKYAGSSHHHYTEQDEHEGHEGH